MCAEAGQAGRIAVFGGTFNPPHAGHIACVRIALAEFGSRIDRVLVVPSNEPYYKEAAFATAEERLEMCRLAFAGMPKVEVSDIDIVRGGFTYTVDTLDDVKARYSPADRPVFILGADSFASLSWWKDSESLLREATFLVIPRGEVCGTDAEGGDIWVAEEVAPQLSSTGIRERIARGESVSEDVPEAVLWYIRSRNLYGSESHVIDVFSDEFIEARKAELKPRVGEFRYAHTLGVAQTAKELAKVYGVDGDKAYLAGLLHDWDKAYDDDGIRARADELGIEVPGDVYWGAPQTLHGVTAAAWFSRAYPEIPADVLQAVSRHTTGAVDMSDLDMVVYIADALEPGRHFEGLDALRGKVGAESLEELFLDVQVYWISRIVERKKTLHPDTFAVWNHYAARHRDRKHKGEAAPGDWSRKPSEAWE